MDHHLGTEWLTLIDSGGNLGFAGGNNVGLRALQGDPAIEVFWLLNNDTVVAAEAPANLLAGIEARSDAGMCGTVVRFYHRPGTVQALGGCRFNAWTGTSAGIGAGPADIPFDAADVARDTDFVLGASLAVTRPFLETVGPMEDRYFLYFEEIDWATRAKGRFGIAFRGWRYRVSQGRRLDRLVEPEGRAQQPVGILSDEIKAAFRPPLLPRPAARALGGRRGADRRAAAAPPARQGAGDDARAARA